MSIFPHPVLTQIAKSVAPNECKLNPADSQISKYKLNITLPKYEYKEYEPVIVQIEMINNDSLPLELWGTFEPKYQVTKTVVTDDKQNTWSVDWFPSILDFAVKGPTIIISPEDTLFIAMSINNAGNERAELMSKDVFFENFGYFIPGNYSAYFDINLDGLRRSGFDKFGRDNSVRGKVRSDTIHFKVNELNDTDKFILDFYNQNKYGKWRENYYIIQNYGDNPLTEHVYAEYIAWKHNDILYFNRYEEENELENDYINFIDRYSYSCYLLIDKFVSPFIFKHFIGIINLKETFEKEFKDFEKQNEDNNLKYFLKDERRTKAILRFEKYFNNKN
jgi:hypothetical protein